MYNKFKLLLCFFLIVTLYCAYTLSFKSNKILTAIVCIDRDSDLAEQLYQSLINNGSIDIIIVTRTTDLKTIKFWSNKAIIKTIPHYHIQKRHNYQKLALKRTIVLDYAKRFNYDAIWFVDSDVIPLPNVLNQLSKTNKDICIAPYKVKWAGFPCVGIKYHKPPYIKLHKIGVDTIPRRECIIGGFGCTLIKKSAFDQTIEYKKISNNYLDAWGEDIGYFLNCNIAGLSCEYLTNQIQPHYYDRFS